MYKAHECGVFKHGIWITRGFVSHIASWDKNLFSWSLWLCRKASLSITAGLKWEFKEKNILVWKSGRKTLVFFWKMSTGWHTTLRGSFENVVIVLTPIFFLYFAARTGNLPKCLFSYFTVCVSLQGFYITEHYDLTSRVNKLKCCTSSPFQFNYCQLSCTLAFSKGLVVLLAGQYLSH